MEMKPIQVHLPTNSFSTYLETISNENSSKLQQKKIEWLKYEWITSD